MQHQKFIRIAHFKNTMTINKPNEYAISIYKIFEVFNQKSMKGRMCIIYKQVPPSIIVLKHSCTVALHQFLSHN